MYITHVSCRNIRGVSGTWEIGPAVMLIGDNYRGKSAVLYAIRLAIFGWIPHPRKDTQMKADRLASADEMEVSITLSDGRNVTRTWTRDKKGSVSCKTIPEADIDLAPAIMLDPKSYFDLSADKRMAFVFSSVKLAKSDFSMQSVLAEVKNIKLEENTEDTEKALQSVALVLSTSIAEAEQEAITIQDWVEHILVTCKETNKTAKQTADRMSKTVAGLTHLELKKPEQFDDEIGEVNIQLAYKRDEVAGLNAAMGGLDEELKQIATRAQKLSSEQRVAGNEATVLADIQANDAANAKYTEALSTPLQNYDAQKAALVARRTVAKQEYDTVIGLMAKTQSEIATKREAIATDTASMASFSRQITALDKEMADLLAEKCCPTCDAPGTEWRERIKQRFAAKLKPLSDSHAIAQNQSIALAADKKVLDAGLTAAQDTIKEMLEKIESIDLEQRNLVAKETDEKTERSRTESLLRECVTKASALGQSLLRINEAKQFVASNSAESDAALRQQSNDASMKLMTANSVIRDLELTRTKIIANKASAASQLQAVQERAKADAEVAIWKETIRVITDFQRRMVDAAFSPMMSVANQFAEGILASPLEYFEGEIGRRRDGRFVPHDQFSDAEQIITYAAMSIALAASAPFKVVAIDEITRVRGHRKQVLVERMIDLVETGVIDQFFGVDTETDSGGVPEYYKNDDVSIIHLK